jgi:hypothetical protein
MALFAESGNELRKLRSRFPTRGIVKSANQERDGRGLRGFFSVLIREWMAPTVRFSFCAIKPARIPEADRSRS